MSCVNRSHPEFKKLANNLDIDERILAARVGVWMSKNTDERFPTIEEISAMPRNRGEYFQLNKVLDMAKRFNMNQSGFMPKNIDLAQAQRAFIPLGYQVVKATSGNWYLKKNGRKVNPFKGLSQIEPQLKEGPYKALNDKLIAWANTHGISIEAIDEMITRATPTGTREQGVVAVASLLDRIITISKDLEKADTLPEEIAHFATAILVKDPSVKKAMEKITETETYKQVKEDYKNIYTEEEQFKKEALDKILAKAIVNQFKETEENKGILAYLKAIFNKFFRKIKSLKPSAEKDIRQGLMPIVNSILNNEYLGEVNTSILEEVTGNEYFQIEETQEESKKEEPILTESEKQKIEFLEEARKLLEERAKILSRRGKGKASTAAILEKELIALDKKIALHQLDAGITSFIDLAKKEIQATQKALGKIDTGEKEVDTSLMYLARKFTEMYGDIFRTFKEDMRFYNFPTSERKRISKEINKVQRALDSVEDLNNSLHRQVAIEVLEDANKDEYGNEIDPNYNPREILETVENDVDYWRLGIGNFKFANSSALRLIHKKIFDSYAKVKRFAMRQADELLQAQERIEKEGFKVDQLVERDSEGKVTGFLLQERDWTGWYRAKAKFKKDLATTLQVDPGLPIDYEALTKDQKSIFREAWKRFHEQNSIVERDAQGKVISTKPAKVNQEFRNLMQNESVKEYYSLLKAKIKESIDKLPPQYRTERNYNKLPGIRRQFVERLMDGKKSFLTNMRGVVAESFFLDEDDTEFGEVTSMNNKMVPIFFMHNVAGEQLSTDLSRSVTIFSEMAENFQEMNKIAGDIEAVMYQLEQNKKRVVKKKNFIKGSQTNEYKAMEVLIDSMVYGIEKKDFSVKKKVPENKFTKFLGIAGKNFSFTKAVTRLSNFIRNNNLAWNITTSTAGYLKGSIDSDVEDRVGLYTTVESKNWARLEYGKNLTEVLSQVGKKKQTNKMHLILQYLNVIELNRAIGNSNSGKLTRKILNKDLMYLNYQTADYGIKGRSTLAMMDNYRLYDGKFITKKDFKELKEKEGKKYREGALGIKKGKAKKEIDKEWAALRDNSLYNAFEVVDSKLEVKENFKDKVTDEVLNTISGKITHVTHLIDGTLSEIDKGAIARSFIGPLVLMHRGWFINMIDNRLIKEKVNYITGEKEIGFYRASGKFAIDLLGKGGIKQMGASWEALTAAERRGVIKTLTDFAYLGILGLFAALVNIAADDDDDDDWTTQYMAYQLNRVLLEQSAGVPWKLEELLQIIDEPVVGVRTIKDLVDVSESWNTDKYEGGMYEGDTHAYTWVFRKTPFKNLYELQFPDMKNNFIKTVLDSPTYNALKQDDDDTGMSVTDKLINFFQDQNINTSNTSEGDIFNMVEAFDQDFN